MIVKPLIAGLLAAASVVAMAQGASAPAGASAAKKELVAKIIKLQQPGIEGVARLLVEQPALQLMQQAGIALQQRVAADKREAIGRDIQADVRKYAEDVFPPVRDKALKLAPGTIAPLLEEKFSEDELKQIIAILESPVNRKYQALGNEMQRALGQKLVAEMRPTIDPKLRELQQSMAKRLGVARPASAASGGK